MKTLILVRHAETQPGYDMADKDRELKMNGIKEAETMAKRLTEKNILPQIIVSSHAKRTMQTAETMAAVFGIESLKIKYLESLYNASPSHIQDAISAIDDTYTSAMIVCHNFGITDFVNALKSNTTFGMPTAGVAIFAIKTNCWKDFSESKNELILFDYP
ncbi:MAG: hypothetical protein RJA07_1378 [Bacteroidota bacterium]|jgi:phosphohistidine phosphatase